MSTPTLTDEPELQAPAGEQGPEPEITSEPAGNSEFGRLAQVRKELWRIEYGVLLLIALVLIGLQVWLLF